ncbi:VanZ family protein [Streptomyces gobiensis]|uniref:VanZ family protein n=1 Tax=Streptomyces gobiensis TaxID=2875706 RepID=UPI001E61C930|nr:VanZ family protein [Streptomyces gobiensis]UGY93289.1 VanZ family protein [Streptomyces gobiensis]
MRDVLPSVQRHRPGGRAAFRIRAAGLALFAGYLLFVGWLTLRPLAVPWVDPVNVELFATIQADLARDPREALWSIGGDLLLLAPLGALLPMVSGMLGSRLGSFARTVFTAGLISLSLAALRSPVPGQMANVDSVVLHVTGVALAHLLLYPVVRGWFRRADQAQRTGTAARTKERPQGRTPRTARVEIAP